MLLLQLVSHKYTLLKIALPEIHAYQILTRLLENNSGLIPSFMLQINYKKLTK